MPSRRSPLTVSVILPTFNRAEFLGEALDSVIGQTHPPLEIIVVDDGSADGTASVCAAYGPALRYIRIMENGGKTAALNVGLELAAGNVIWVMDDDDIAPPDALKSLLTPLQDDPSIDFTFGSLRKFTVNGDGDRVFATAAEPRPAGARHLFSHLMEDCFITGQPCALFRRSCFDDIRPLDTSITASVDYNILLQVARRGHGAEVDQVVLWQRQHAGARGPQAARYASHERVQRWRKVDSQLLAELLPDLKPHEFLENVSAAQSLTPIQMRRALLQKAVIAARKELWDVAHESLVAALDAAAWVPCGPRDLEILSRFLGSRYGIDTFLGSAKTQSKIATASRRARNGRAVQMAIASMLTFWAGQGLRRMDTAYAAKCVGALYRVAGLRGAFGLAFSALNRRLELRPMKRRASRSITSAPASYAGEEHTTNGAN